jgi:hypothetical protein
MKLEILASKNSGYRAKEGQRRWRIDHGIKGTKHVK